MYIAHHMSKPVATIKPGVFIPEAIDILRDKKFRHLPVVNENGRLLGIVSDRDLRSAYPSSLLPEDERIPVIARIERTSVEKIMTREPVTLSRFSTLDDALYLFTRRNVGALPVIDDDGKVVGIFTNRDMLTAYKHLFGLGSNDSALIEIEDDGELHILTRIVEALERNGIVFSRLLKTQPIGPGSQKSCIYVRVHTINLHGVYNVLISAGLKPIVPSQQ